MSVPTFIVEGSDLLGKSTFIQKIQRNLGIEKVFIQHAGLETLDYSIHQWEEHMLHCPPSFKCKIMDRGPLSEVVYGTQLRSGSSISMNEYKDLCSVVPRLKQVVFWAEKDDYDIILQNMWDGSEAFNKEQLVKINKAYSTIITKKNHIEGFPNQYLAITENLRVNFRYESNYGKLVDSFKFWLLT